MAVSVRALDRVTDRVWGIARGPAVAPDSPTDPDREISRAWGIVLELATVPDWAIVPAAEIAPESATGPAGVRRLATWVTSWGWTNLSGRAVADVPQPCRVVQEIAPGWPIVPAVVTVRESGIVPESVIVPVWEIAPAAVIVRESAIVPGSETILATTIDRTSAIAITGVTTR